MKHSVLLTLCLLALAGTAPAAAEVRDAHLILEVWQPPSWDRVPEAAPPRFVLLKDRQVYVGGSSQLLRARLEKDDLKPIEKLIKKVRKLKGLESPLALGPGETSFRLSLLKGKRLEITARGDPSAAPPALRDLARLLAELSDFHHPRLRPYEPSSYALSVRKASLAGGCRTWDMPGVALPDPQSQRIVPARAVSGWPTGSRPALVCEPGGALLVTLQPLLPGQTR